MAIKVKIAGEESERKFKGDLVVAFCVDEKKSGVINVDAVAVGDFSYGSAAAIGEGIANLITRLDEEEPVFCKCLKMGLIKALSEAMND